MQNPEVDGGDRGGILGQMDPEASQQGQPATTLCLPCWPCEQQLTSEVQAVVASNPLTSQTRGTLVHGIQLGLIGKIALGLALTDTIAMIHGHHTRDVTVMPHQFHSSDVLMSW